MSHVDPLDLEAQDRVAKERSEQSRETSRQEAEDFKWLMSDKRGRRIVWRLLEKTGVYRSSFTGNSETFFREGARNVGLMLMTWIHDNCPDQYTKMLKEHQDDQRIRESKSGRK